MKKIFILCSVAMVMWAGVLSDNKEALYELEKQEAIKKSESLKEGLIEPINLNYNNTNGAQYDSESFSLNISQPIFKSGGIYYTIKYATALKEYELKNALLSRQELLHAIYTTTLKLRQIDLKIERQILLINNSQIEVEEKEHKFLNGLLSVADLDNAILEKNTYSNVLLDLQISKEELLLSLRKLTSLDYKEIGTPEIKLLDENAFIKNNLYVKQDDLFVKLQGYSKEITTSNYLPQVSLTYEYNDYLKETTQSSNANEEILGVKVSWPFSLNASTEKERAQLSHLKSTVLLRESINDEKKLYKQNKATIALIDKKIAITNDDKSRYKNLLIRVEALYNNGLESEKTYKLLKNSYAIREIDIKNLVVDKTITMLKIYAKTEELK